MRRVKIMPDPTECSTSTPNDRRPLAFIHVYYMDPAHPDDASDTESSSSEDYGPLDLEWTFFCAHPEGLRVERLPCYSLDERDSKYIELGLRQLQPRRV